MVILFVVCIMVIVDVFDVLVSKWVYKEVLFMGEVVNVIYVDRGKYFDFLFIDLFFEI